MQTCGRMLFSSAWPCAIIECERWDKLARSQWHQGPATPEWTHARAILECGYHVGRCIYRLFDVSGLDDSQFLLKIFHGIAPAVSVS
jgi:hypothetical protein